jgi:hypothetical protein
VDSKGGNPGLWGLAIAVAAALACGRVGFEAVDSPCQGIGCGSGICVVAGDVARCQCDEGHHEDGLSCVPDGEACDSIPCSGHGRCVVLGEQPICLCDPGYHSAGTDCVADGSACDGVDCSGHGLCGITSAGMVLCACFPGYRNDGPTACVPDPTSGNCGIDADCEDDNPCTDDICEPEGSCRNPFNKASCNDGFFCTVEDTCDGAGSCVGAPRDCEAERGPCVQDAACDEQLDLCTGLPVADGTRCDDGNSCTEGDVCLGGECGGTPLLLGADCGPDGGRGDGYLYCFEGKCTCWCNNSHERPPGPMPACPDGFYCELHNDTDSAGYCLRHPSSGTRQNGEDCGSDGECLGNKCIDGRCTDTCSSTADCRNSGPSTSDWVCRSIEINMSGVDFDHGRCAPPLGAGRTGIDCMTGDDCADGRCYEKQAARKECREMCCTEADCGWQRTCWFWFGGHPQSTQRLCVRKELRGPNDFGTPCFGIDYYDETCYTGLCVDVGEGERCNRFCCRNTDCPDGYRCDFAFLLERDENKRNFVRACVPD